MFIFGIATPFRHLNIFSCPRCYSILLHVVVVAKQKIVYWFLDVTLHRHMWFLPKNADFCSVMIQTVQRYVNNNIVNNNYREYTTIRRRYHTFCIE